MQSFASWGQRFFDSKLCSDRCQERLDADDVHYAGEIVGQNV